MPAFRHAASVQDMFCICIVFQTWLDPDQLHELSTELLPYWE
jgi:hypothetical protein